MTDQKQTTALARVDDLDLSQLGAVLAQCGYFKDIRDKAQAIVKILVGRELGIAPLAAVMGIHVIDGKPSIGAHLIALGVKRSKRYDYRVVDKTDERCSIDFFEKLDGKIEKIGTETFTLDDAKKANLTGRSNWKAHTKAMLFARCIGQGYRTHCPDAFDLPVYAEGEIEQLDEKPAARPKEEPTDASFEVKPPRTAPKKPEPELAADFKDAPAGDQRRPQEAGPTPASPAGSPSAGPATTPSAGPPAAAGPPPASPAPSAPPSAPPPSQAAPTAADIFRCEITALLDLKRPAWRAQPEADAAKATTATQLKEILDGVRKGLGVAPDAPALLPQTRALLASLTSSGAPASPSSPPSSAPTGGSSTTPAPKASGAGAGTASEAAGGPPQKREGRPAFSGQGGRP